MSSFKKGDRVATSHGAQGKTGEITEVRDGYATVQWSHERPSGRILTAGYYPVSQLIPVPAAEPLQVAEPVQVGGSKVQVPKPKAKTADIIGRVPGVITENAI